jgi:prepilin-type N-terminal cleavage/methylation domain-containing protein
MKSLRKGFTLVELMVVIVIIGILAALAIPRFLGATNKAKATEFKPVLKQIYTLEEAYRQESAGGVYGTFSKIAWDVPSGSNTYFWYGAGADVATSLTSDTGAAPPAYVGTAGSILATATPSTNGKNISVNGTKLTSTDNACVDQVGGQFSYGNLSKIAGASVPPGTNAANCN